MIKKNESQFTLMAFIGLIFISIVSTLLFVSLNKKPVEYTEAIAESIELIKSFAENKEIVNELKVANEEHSDLTNEEILRMDAEWRSTDVTSKQKIDLHSNEASAFLVEIQNMEPKFAEIFITDSYGLNIAQTNVTTDYYQADESWWVEAYDNGVGYYGNIEFDESAQKWSVPIYTRLEDENEEVIGVVKALLDTSKIR